MYPKAMVFLAIVGVSLSLLLGLFSVITLEVVALSVMVFIGIPTLMTQVNVKPKEEERKQEQERDILRDETIRMKPQDKSDSHNVNSKDLEVYSLIHTMIIRVNREVPRETALELGLVGAWVGASLMNFNFNNISEVFNQHSDKFTDKDLDMWLEIEKEIKTKNGFFLGKKRQEWFDELEARYNRLKRSKQIR